MSIKPRNPRGCSRSTRRARLRIGEVILLSRSAPKEGWRTVGVGQVSVRMQSLHPEAGPLSGQEEHRHRSWHPYAALPRWVPTCVPSPADPSQWRSRSTWEHGTTPKEKAQLTAPSGCLVTGSRTWPGSPARAPLRHRYTARAQAHYSRSDGEQEGTFLKAVAE